MMDTTSASEEMVRNLTDLPDKLGAAACFGSPVERDGHTLIPVARISFGYGLGFGRGSGGSNKASPNGEHADAEGEGGEGEGGGGGGGGSSSPVAVIDITRDDVMIKPIMDPTRIRLGTMMMAAWSSFWLFHTIRTIARERSKTRREQLKRAET